MIMEIAICAIARFENRYIKEWVDYHLSIGFSKIYIYDNNREGDERICNVIDPTISLYRGKVEVIPWHEETKCPQIKAYNDCYNRNEFDWVAFIDIDEFITFAPQSGIKNMTQFLSKFKNYDAVLLNWMGYGDNGHCYYEAKSVQERFLDPFPRTFSTCNLWGKQPWNGHVKTIIRKGLKMQMNSPHIGHGDYKCCNAEGVPVQNLAYQPSVSHNTAYIRHYITKTIEEFIWTKGRRPAADGSFERYSISSFFWYNKPTFKKIKIWHKYCQENHIEDSRSIFWWIKCWIKMYFITPFIS